MGWHGMAYAKQLGSGSEGTLTELNGDSVVPPYGDEMQLVALLARQEGGSAIDYIKIESNVWPGAYDLEIGDVQNDLAPLRRFLRPSETITVKAKQSTGASKYLFVALLIRTADPEVPRGQGEILARQVTPTAGAGSWGGTPATIGPGTSDALIPSHDYALIGAQVDEGIIKVEATSFAGKPAFVGAEKPLYLPTGMRFRGDDTLKVYACGPSASAVNVVLFFEDLGPSRGGPIATRAPTGPLREMPTRPGITFPGGFRGILREIIG
ncbi:MAG: hypothetical protein DRI93_04430 [Aquificota bacterium]|nr:MAG: hypothetical protein DRI93_04430 [Aquificota bacterium]